MKAAICSKKFLAKAFLKILMLSVQGLEYAISSQYCSWARSDCGRHCDLRFLHLSYTLLM